MVQLPPSPTGCSHCEPSRQAEPSSGKLALTEASLSYTDSVVRDTQHCPSQAAPNWDPESACVRGALEMSTGKTGSIPVAESPGQRRRTQEMDLYGLFPRQAQGTGPALRETRCRTTGRRSRVCALVTLGPCVLKTEVRPVWQWDPSGAACRA